jgi:hypothetical protein
VADHASARIVEQIGEEEESHVAAGLKWFAHVAWTQGKVPHPRPPRGRVPELELYSTELYDTKGSERRHDGGAAKREFMAAVEAGAEAPEEIACAPTTDPVADMLAAETDDDAYMRVLGEHWRQEVLPYFPDGVFPPFNRIARYAAGIPEHWYMPIMNTKVFIEHKFHSVPSSAPSNAVIRGKYKKLTEHIIQKNEIKQ